MFYTRTPNHVYDAMPDMGYAELKCTMALVRQTYGFHRDEARVTYDDFAEATGLSRQGISDGLEAVERRGFFERGSGRSAWKTVKQVDQNSLPARLNGGHEQSSKQTETVKQVDQNSQVSRPKYRSTKEKKERVKEIDPHVHVHMLAQVFQEKTGFDPPHESTDMWLMDWVAPLGAIYRRAGEDAEAAGELVGRAIDVCRGDNEQGKTYTIKNPGSILTAALNLQIDDGHHTEVMDDEYGGFYG